MKKIFAFALLLASCYLLGCNTVAGIGQDVSAAGGAVSNASYQAKSKM
ncbi:MAG: entericidin A/B family lipoprotein [Cardiobacteriaceae bacterium]|nr:entericidin A/B family lipoprotein [Cardiobacteriaceae bacterium]